MKRLGTIFSVVVVGSVVVACPPDNPEIEGNNNEGEGEDVGEGEGEGDEGVGEGEGEGEGDVVIDCAHPGEFGAVTIGDGWEVGDVVTGGFLASGDRLAADADGAVTAFIPAEGVLEAWGTWPTLARSAEKTDVLVAAHRAAAATLVFQGRSLAFDGETLLFTYATGAGGTVEGGLFVDEGDGPAAQLVHNPFSARLLGSRVLVAAAALGGAGSTTSGAPLSIFGRDGDGTVTTLVTAAEPVNDLVRMALLDDTVVVTRASGATPAALQFSTERILQNKLDDETDPTSFAVAANSEFAGDVVDSFDVDDGVAFVTGFSDFGPGEDVVVVKDAPGGFSVEQVVAVDGACARVTVAFAVAGAPVVGVQDANTGAIQLLGLQRSP